MELCSTATKTPLERNAIAATDQKAKLRQQLPLRIFDLVPLRTLFGSIFVIGTDPRP
jgi:hypothetical protein